MAVGDAFLLSDTGSETNVLHTTEADRGLSGSPTLEQGDWSSQWSSPELTVPTAGLKLFGYMDVLRSSGTSRSGAVCQFSLNTGGGHSNVGIAGVTSWGYNRLSGGADESSRHGCYLANLSVDDLVKVREGTQLNGSDRRGDYDRNSGDPRALWAVDFAGQDYIISEITGTDVGSGRYRNASPIDLGTPAALTAGTWKQVTFDSTAESQGTTITRSGSTHTIAANKKVLLSLNAQALGPTDRTGLLFQVDVDGDPYCYVTLYNRDANTDESTTSVLVPIVTGGSSSTVDLYFVDEAEDTGLGEIDIQALRAGFVDVTDADVVILGKSDADVTDINGTVQQISFPTADEIVVDSGSFDHPSGNLTRIENNAGQTITVLAGFVFCGDRSSLTPSVRKWPFCRLRRNGTQLEVGAGETSRGSQSSDDNRVGGASFGQPVELTSSQYLELDIYDLAGNSTQGMILNSSDGAAVLFWAIRLDALGVSGTNYDETGLSMTVTSTLGASEQLGLSEALSIDVTSTLGETDALAGSESASLTVTSTLSASDDAAGSESVSIDIVSTLAGSDGFALDDTGLGFTITSSLSATDSHAAAETLGFTITSSLSESDQFAGGESASLTVTSTLSASDDAAGSESVSIDIVSTLSASDGRGLDETGSGFTITSTTTGTDLLNGGGFDETGLSIDVTSTLGETDALAGAESASLTVTSTLSASDDAAGSESVSIDIVSTLAGSAGFAVAESVSIDIVSTLAGSELLALDETGSGFTITSTLGETDALAGAESASLTVTSTLSASDVSAMFETADSYIEIVSTLAIETEIYSRPFAVIRHTSGSLATSAASSGSVSASTTSGSGRASTEAGSTSVDHESGSTTKSSEEGSLE